MCNSPDLHICSESVEKAVNFWKSIKLYVTKPHTVTRQLAGAKPIAVFHYQHTNGHFIKDVEAINDHIQYRNELLPNKEFIPNLFLELKLNGNLKQIDSKCLTDDEIPCDGSWIIQNKLLPKNLKLHDNCVELIIMDFSNKCVSFISLASLRSKVVNKSFTIGLTDVNDSNGSATMWAKLLPRKENLLVDDEAKQRTWVQHVLFSKLLKWINSMDDEPNGVRVESLSLVSLEEYNVLYNELKIKYGENMVKIWPEQTDPAKFVYEDVAIATYLLLLWRKERIESKTNELQSFVDLGCGNGLLVYILSSEGHRGYGIDIRKRGIWDLYPTSTVLKIEAFSPSNQSLLPNIDWIIGNHSDELSPWIPVVAARSSYQTKYFLLPCCAYEFSGKKYQRRNCKDSQYMDFLNYVNRISEQCGFATKFDRLKIPSTKRICLIGTNRLYAEHQWQQQNQLIQEFIDADSKTDDSSNQNVWNTEFKPRSDIEKVQNCTKINKIIEMEIVQIVFDQLMVKKRFLPDLYRPDWNVGGKVSLADLIKFIPREKLKELKSECGGLQTLLKNNSQIFRVIGGCVEIRQPVKLTEKLLELETRNGGDSNKFKDYQFKQRACWFLAYHPNGCPYDSIDCSFKH